MKWMTKVEIVRQKWVKCLDCNNEWLHGSQPECGCEEE